jgi:hypothetical protein
VWAERAVVKIFNLLVHPVTSRLLKVKEETLLGHVAKFQYPTRLDATLAPAESIPG